MAEAEDHRPLQSKCKAIAALLPYAVWQERDGQPEVLDMLLHAIGASRERQFTWSRIERSAITLLVRATPRAVVLTVPRVRWRQLTGTVPLIRWWAATVLEVPYTDEVGQSVVDMLFQIASEGGLAQHIPVPIWSWLTKRPPLPPTCLGRYLGARSPVVDAVRACKDIEVLKSYFLLVWSEWDDLQGNHGFNKMCASIREDFDGIGMRPHRAELIQRLDHILEQLDRGLEHPWLQYPDLVKPDLWKMMRRYRKLREVLREVERRTPSSLTTRFLHTNSSNGYACSSSHARSFPCGTTGLICSPRPFTCPDFSFYPHL